MVASGPALTVAAGQIVRTFISLELPQLPVAVKVNCTSPVAISSALGV